MDRQISFFDTAPELFSTADAELMDVLRMAAHGWESSKQLRGLGQPHL